jgi:hypothetical protein
MTQLNPSSVVGRISPAPDSPDENLLKFIKQAKDSPALRGIDWAEVEWTIGAEDVVAKKIRGHRSYHATLTFTTRESSMRGMSRKAVNLRTPLPAQYAELAKADVRMHAEASASNLDVLRRRLTAHQFLERAWRLAGGGKRIGDLGLRDFHLAEDDLVKELNATTAYKVAQHLEAIARTLNSRRLADVWISYAVRIKRPLGRDELTEEGQAKGMEKMISDEALEAFGSISANPADDDERHIIRVVDLLVCGGFRVGEVLTMPFNCWHEVSSDTKPKFGSPSVSITNHGLLYAAEKAQDFRVKWLPQQAVELAKRAVDDLTRLTKPMREVARWMELNPGRLIIFKDHAQDDFIEGRRACKLMGLVEKSFKNWKIFKQQRDDSSWFRVGDIEALYLMGWSLAPVLSMPSGAIQKRSETLVLVWENQFHGNRPALKFLPRTMTTNMFADRISPAPSRGAKVAGLLSRFKFRVKSHQIRHWLNTIAAHQGMSDLDLAKWMGRIDLRQNLAYKHGTLAVRTAAARKLILSGEAKGAVSRAAETLPLAEREAFVAAAVETAHATNYGMCVHNFATAPCPKSMQCLRKCGEYLRVKGDADQRAALLDLRQLEEANRKRAQLALQDGFYGADKWVANSTEVLEGIDEALAVDDDLTLPDGAETKVFDGPSNQKKLL